MSRLLIACLLLGSALSAGAADIVRGGDTYQRHCARCHGTTGVSTWPGAPNLARREGLMQPDTTLLQTLRKGRGAKPGYQGLLTDAEILNAIAYARSLAR